MSFNCDFCNKEFSSKSSLTLHKKTAKYCLEIQRLKNDSIKDNSDFFKKKINYNECVSQELEEDITDRDEKINYCEFCNKEFNYKCNLVRHYNICKKKEKREKDISKENEIILLKEQINKLNKDKIELEKEKDNEIKILKEEKNKLQQDKMNFEKEKLSMEYEIKNLKILLSEEKNRLKDEKDRVNELVNKNKNNINTTNIQNNIYKDNFDELFEKLPNFTKENLINTFKEVLNEDIFLQGIDCFSKVVNRKLGDYGIVSDFSRHKIVIKDKDGNQVNTISPKVFIDSINNIEELTKEVLAKSREKVDTFAILEQDVYINNLYPIKELILNCENEQTSDKNIMKYGKKLTDNCQVVTRTNLPSDNLIEMTSL